jgi:hypothetical protein
MEEYKEKQVGKMKGINPSFLEADQLQKTVQKLRPTKGVCKKGLYKFRTFEEADQWMERMILKAIQECRH